MPDTRRATHFWRRWPLRLGLAVVSVALAQWVELLLGPEITGISPLFFVAVVFSAFVGGWQSGLLATALACVCTAGIYFNDVDATNGLGLDDAFRLLVFTGVALTVSWLQQINLNATDRAVAATGEAEAARRQADLARRQAEAANTAKDRFLNVLGHELRNPLNPVLTLVTMRLQDHADGRDARGGHSSIEADAQLREDLEMIRRNVEVEARLIDDLLDSSRIRSGKLRLVRQGVNVLRLLGETVEAVRPTAAEAGLELVYHAFAGDDDETAVIDGDPIRLRQIFWNLLNNAIKFTKRGKVAVAAHATLGRRGVVIAVADTGPGIDPTMQDVIFEPFVQAEREDGAEAGSSDGPVGGEAGGLGLGLSIVRGFVTAHGGSIGLRSRRGRGSVFRIKLPAAWIACEELTDPLTDTSGADPSDSGVIDALPAEGSGTGDDQRVSLRERRPMRILLVEDHLDTARVTARLLKREGHTVTIAGSVAAGLAAARDEPFDLVVSDIGLGDGNGCDLMAQLRDRHGLVGIAVSGFATDADVRRSRAAGFFVHLVKPVSLETLSENINAVADIIGEDGEIEEGEALAEDSGVDEATILAPRVGA